MSKSTARSAQEPRSSIETRMDPNLNPDVWKALLSGEPLDRLGLPTVNGRIDLRGLVAQQPTVAHESTTPIADVKRLANITEVRGARWRGIDFSNSRLDSVRLIHSSIEDCCFDEAQCHDWRMWATTISNCTFRNADLRRSSFGGVDEGQRNAFRGVDFTRADLRQTGHKAAEMSGCTFVDTNLTKVDFQGTVFVNCVFAGELREVLFYRHAFEGETFPPNEMKGVDFRRARFRDVEFRGLDMDQVTWPEDANHIVVEDYKVTLNRMLDVMRDRSDKPARMLKAVLEMELKWAGPNRRRGVINKLDLLEAGDPALASELLLVCGRAVH
jgi:uncharacterized protein YjbI with pentapeptide repeats